MPPDGFGIQYHRTIPVPSAHGSPCRKNLPLPTRPVHFRHRRRSGHDRIIRIDILGRIRHATAARIASAAATSVAPTRRLTPTPGAVVQFQIPPIAIATPTAIAAAAFEIKQRSATTTSSTATAAVAPPITPTAAIIGAAPIAPQRFDAIKHAAAFATRLTVVIATLVARIAALRRMVDPGIDV